MEWYIPITIIPGISLIILSTSNIILDLNREIEKLEDSEKEYSLIIKDKLKQLKLLSVSIAFQYVGILFFLFSGIIGFFISNLTIPKYMLISGVVFIFFSILFLLHYSVKAVIIRQKHLKL